MVFEGLFGPGGSYIVALDDLIPSASSILGIGVLILFLVYMFKSHSMKSESIFGNLWMPIVIMVVLYTLTGSAAGMFLVLIILLFTGFHGHGKVKKEKYGSKKSKKKRKKAGFDVEGEEKVINKEQAMEKEKPSGGDVEKAASKVEVAAAEEAERMTEVNVHTETMAAGADSVGDTVTDLLARIEALEARRKHAGDVILAADKQVEELGKVPEEEAKKGLVRIMEGMGNAIKAIVESKKLENKYRDEALKELKDSVKISKEAVKNGLKVEKSVQKVERGLAKLSLKEVKKVQKAIDDKIKLEEKLDKPDVEKMSVEAVHSVMRQTAKLRKEIPRMKKSKAVLELLEKQLNENHAKIKLSMKKLHKDLREVKKVDEEIVKKEKEMEKYADRFDSVVKEMTEAYGDFKKALSNVDKKPLEELSLISAKNIGIVYGRLIKSAEMSVSFNKEQVVPFITSVIGVMPFVEGVAKSSYFINYYFIQLTQGFQKVDQEALKVISGGRAKERLLKDLNEEKIQENLARYVAGKGKQLINFLDSSVVKLGEARTAVESSEVYLQKEISDAKMGEKVTLGVVGNVLKKAKKYQKKTMAKAA